MYLNRNTGFTLAELLIALAIVGILATFTIPKILDASNSSKFSAVAKEAASMVSGGYSSYKLNSTPDTGTTAGVITQYVNYVGETTVNPSSVPSGETAMASCAAADCSDNTKLCCLVLHNGAIMQYHGANTFGGTSTTHAWLFNVDPDGDKAGAGGATFVQYFNGRLTTRGNSGAVNVGYMTGGTAATEITSDPSWISSWN